MTKLKKQLEKKHLKHIAIIMDGNRRWAKKHKVKIKQGHETGTKIIQDIILTAKKLQVKYLTIYAFSTENWNRNSEEVDGLMQLLHQAFELQADKLTKAGVKLEFVGSLDKLPKELVQKIKQYQTEEVIDSQIDNRTNSTVDNRTNSTVDNHTNSTVDNRTNSTVDNHTNSIVDNHTNSIVDNHTNSIVDNHTNSTVDNQINNIANDESIIQVNVAINYGSRQEILHATKKISINAIQKKIKPENITQSDFVSYLYTYPVPDPDLIIRTGGQQRLSNFLLWQASYSELYFTKVLWPDYRPYHLIKAIKSFLNRNRSYGGCS